MTKRDVIAYAEPLRSQIPLRLFAAPPSFSQHTPHRHREKTKASSRECVLQHQTNLEERAYALLLHPLIAPKTLCIVHLLSCHSTGKPNTFTGIPKNDPSIPLSHWNLHMCSYRHWSHLVPFPSACLFLPWLKGATKIDSIEPHTAPLGTAIPIIPRTSKEEHFPTRILPQPMLDAGNDVGADVFWIDLFF